MYEHIDNENQVCGTCKLTKNNVCCQIYRWRIFLCYTDVVHVHTIWFITEQSYSYWTWQITKTSNTKHTHTHLNSSSCHGRSVATIWACCLLSPASVPVCFHSLIIPDSWRLCVTEVARLTSVVCGKEQQRLHWKWSQVPLLKILHVLVSEGTGRSSEFRQ